MTPSASPKSEKLNFATKLAFGAGDMGTAITANLLVWFFLIFLTNVAGLGAGLAGSVVMVGKVWDAINDPMVGMLSDRTRSRWGRRLPWMVLGAIPLGISFFLMWVVPPLDKWALFSYYVVLALLFHIFYTVVNLPYAAMTPELTQDYDERTSLNSFRFAFSLGGALLSLILAQVIFAQLPGPEAQQYLVLGGICAVLAVLPVFVCVWGVRDRALAFETRRRAKTPTATMPFREQLRVAFRNRPFLYVIGIYLFSWLSVQLTAAIIPFFIATWMNLPSTAMAQVALTVQGTALIMLFPWSALSRRVGKKTVYYIGMILWIGVQAGLFFVQPDQVALLYFLAVLAGFGVSTAYLIPWSMIPDVVDLDELNTGERREGVFYSFMVLLQKIGLALGIFLVGQALGWAGYIESTAGQPAPVQPDSALLAIRLAIGPLPTLFLICGLVLAYFYPITREVHAEILLKLSERRRLAGEEAE
ncbi:MFS transporter [Synechococcales cyanobacterium C]|uniref:MFS transporter n=1 Tax=Petrachloros mirabilis ULC683 TaxID=2781853 RepID=A0A8K2A709_9CYAN|nr:MFS transporter [Petrachloros mirabilis]NCJ05555.1 MFS transporter [Petrachloros mirabilis ULC683]